MKYVPTFKKHPKATGLAAISDRPQIDIKFRNKRVGIIHQPTAFRGMNNWQIGFMIVKADLMEDGNPNCPWRWLFVKNDATDEESARSWVKRNFESFTKRYNLWSHDAD